MIGCFNKIKDGFAKKTINIKNKKLNKSISNYNFLSFPDNNIDQIISSIKCSRLIVINQSDEKLYKYFIIGFEKSILFFDQSQISFFDKLFEIKDNKVLFLSKSEILIESYLKKTIPKMKYNSFFSEEMSNFISELNITSKCDKNIIKIWSIITPCISGYLIQKNYILDTFRKFNFNYISSSNPEEYYLNTLKMYENLKKHTGISCTLPSPNSLSPSLPQKIDDDDFITLRIIGKSIFRVDLIYLIEREKLSALKRVCNNDDIYSMEREISIYSTIKHPLMPEFYAIKPDKYFAIEFINGLTLRDYIIKHVYKNENDLFSIIFELMIILEYFHRNHYIYRDLKPSNVMIDQDGTAVLIDFDKMKFIKNKEDIKDFTVNIGTIYAAPEIETIECSYECDIYSLGQMIYFIMNGKDPISKNMSLKDFENYPKIKDFYKKCTKFNASERISLKYLIIEFFFIFNSKINIFDTFTCENYFKRIFNDEVAKILNLQYGYINQNPYFTYNFGILFYEGIYVQKDIHRAIEYLTIAAEEGIYEAQLLLSKIYIEGKIVTRDIDKSIHFLSLDSNDKDSEASYNLAMIYYEGKYTPVNIKAAIHNFSIAAEDGHPAAIYYLGLIYYDNKYIARDINKALEFFFKGAEIQDAQSQYALGVIYREGEYVEQDIDISIHYYSYAADQNHYVAQLDLGQLYISEEYGHHDINKGIHYLTLSANNGVIKAQINLGIIFLFNEIVSRDTDKAIHYFTLAANQGDPLGNYFLGYIYYNECYGKLNINEAIKYFVLSSNQNHSSAQLMLGTIYYENIYVNRNINKAIYYFELAANQNINEAQFFLGDIFFNGKYIKRDINKGINYYIMAANNGNCDAQNTLGVIYSDGKEVKVDIEKSIFYFNLASHKNSPVAQFNLGIIYYNDIYVKRDLNKSIHYFTLAASQNYPEANYYLGLINKIFFKDKNKDKRAVEYFSQAAEQDFSGAKLNIGLAYLYGQGVKQDITKGIKLIMEDADHGNKEAQGYIGYFYLIGYNVPCDFGKSFDYFQRSAYQGLKESQYFLSIFYYYGIHVNQNPNIALYYLEESANNGLTLAYFMTGYLFHMGKNVDRNINKAIHYYKEASSLNDQYAKINLGIIYKNGHGNDVVQNISYAIQYFTEVLDKNDNLLAIYNLANIYFFNEKFNDNIKSIKLLLKTASKSINEKMFNWIPNMKSDLNSIYNQRSIGMNDIKNLETKMKNNSNNTIHVGVYKDKSLNFYMEYIEKLRVLISCEFVRNPTLRTYYESMELLCLILIKKFGGDLKNIKNWLDKIQCNNIVSKKICDMIEINHLNIKLIFENRYEYHKTNNMMYFADFVSKPAQVNLQIYNNFHINKKENISKSFYDGLGNIFD